MPLSYYAVRRGRVPGIYSKWAEAHEQVDGYPGNSHMRFDSYEEAEQFMGGKIERRRSRDASLMGGIDIPMVTAP